MVWVTGVSYETGAHTPKVSGRAISFCLSHNVPRSNVAYNEEATHKRGRETADNIYQGRGTKRNKNGCL